MSRIYIDCQLFQTDAWHRGMGKYSLQLLASIVPNIVKSGVGITLVFSKYDMPSKNVLSTLKDIVPNAKLIFLDLEASEYEDDRDLTEKMEHNKYVLDRYITKQHEPSEEIYFLILALFVDSICSVFPTLARKILIAYDIIPLLYSERYIVNQIHKGYLTRYAVLFEADLMLTISQTVADDLMLFLGVGQDRLVNIKGGAIPRSKMKKTKPTGIGSNKFMLMPSGDDLRKNNINAVLGFDRYKNASEDSDIELYITSNFSEEAKAELRELSDSITFVGNVSESEMSWLYKNAVATLFVPEYEGLGLPLLESVEVSKPVVCSDISVFREISRKAFYFVDQLDTKSIANGIKSALSQKDWISKKEEYIEVAKSYDWPLTGSIAWGSIENANYKVFDKPKKRIAVFTPNPEKYSAVGKVVMQLHPALAEHFDVDYYVEDPVNAYKPNSVRPSYLDKITKVKDASTFNVRDFKKYVSVIYHIGNSEFHVETVKNALYLPGVSIIHDTSLKGLFNGPLLGKGYVSNRRIELERKLNNANSAIEGKAEFLSSMVNAQRAVITHSKYARTIVEQINDAVPVIKANLPVASPFKIYDRPAKSRLNIALAGIISPIKGVNYIEEIASDNKFARCNIFVFGFSMMNEEELRQLEAYENVTVAKDLSDFEFQTLLSKMDILVNYRVEYHGETSLTVLEAMRYGVVPIVKDVGWYSELPDDATVKVSKSSGVLSELKRLISRPNELAELRKNAYIYAKTNHSFKSYADDIKDIINNILQEGSGNKTNEKIVNALKKGRSSRSVKRIINKSYK